MRAQTPSRTVFLNFVALRPSRKAVSAVLRALPRSFSAKAGIGAAVAVMWALSAAAQTPTYTTSTTLVPVFATVTDEHDRLITSLTADNFEILDDGKPQPLAVFANQAQPLTLVILLDTSVGMTAVFDDLRAAAEQFVIRLLPGDRARICAFNDRIQWLSDFTGDRDALARATRDVDYGNETRLYDAMAASLDALRSRRGRKVVLVLSQGQDTISRTRRSAIIDRAKAEDVMVYAIGFRLRYRDEDDELVWTNPDSALRTLATQTGGGFLSVKHRKDLEGTFTRVLDELHSQYLLAFAPPANDGRVHHLDVQATRKSFRVRARRTYLARRPQ